MTASSSAIPYWNILKDVKIAATDIKSATNVLQALIAVFIKVGEAAFSGPNQKFETFETAKLYAK